MNPGHAFALRNELVPYAFWRFGKELAGPDKKDKELESFSPLLKPHIDFALDMLTEHPLELSGAMVRRLSPAPSRDSVAERLCAKAMDLEGLTLGS